MDVVKEIERSMEWEPRPRYTNYMSDIGHPCERFLVYTRTHWRERDVPSARRLMTMADGQVHETMVLDLLRKAGFQVQEQQSRLFDDYLKLSGKLDCRLVIQDDLGGSWLVEVKSMSPWIWEKTETYWDIVHSRFTWVRHYAAQLQAYLHYDREKNGQESRGLFILKNKATGQLRAVEVQYDEDFALELMLKAERINKAVEKVLDVEGNRHEEHLPARIDAAEGMCEGCDFKLTCLPDLEMGQEAEVVHDEELLEMLHRREELAPLAKEYDRLDKACKGSLKGRPTALIGEDFVSHSKLIARKAYSVKAGRYWRTDIKRRGETAPAEDEEET